LLEERNFIKNSPVVLYNIYSLRRCSLTSVNKFFRRSFVCVNSLVTGTSFEQDHSNRVLLHTNYFSKQYGFKLQGGNRIVTMRLQQLKNFS